MILSPDTTEEIFQSFSVEIFMAAFNSDGPFCFCSIRPSSQDPNLRLERLWPRQVAVSEGRAQHPPKAATRGQFFLDTTQRNLDRVTHFCIRNFFTANISRSFILKMGITENIPITDLLKNKPYYKEGIRSLAKIEIAIAKKKIAIRDLLFADHSCLVNM